MNRHERRAALAMLRGKGDAFQADALKAEIERMRAEQAEIEQAAAIQAAFAAMPWWRQAAAHVVRWVVARFRK